MKTSNRPASGLWIVVRDARAGDEIGWAKGPFRIKGHEAIYQTITLDQSDERTDNVKLARVGNYIGTECRGGRDYHQHIEPDTRIEFLSPDPASLPGPLRTPTRGDLIALLTWAAHEIGGAHSDHANDRDPNGFEKAQDRLTAIQERLRDAAGRFPYPRKSPWTTSAKPRNQ